MNLSDNKTGKLLIKAIPVIIILALIVQFVLVSASNNANSPETPIIGITLEYAPGTEFDADNDGIEYTTGVIDYTVEGSEFNWEVDQEKLSTQWEVYSQESGETTQLCYGSQKGCNFVDLEPSLENWSEHFDLNYERYGATYNNTVSSRIIYADYNITPEEPYSEIYYSDKISLPARFIEEPEITLPLNETNITPNITNPTKGNITFSPVIKDASGNELDIKLDIMDPKTDKLERRYRKDTRHLMRATADSKITSKKEFKIEKGKYNINVEINEENPIKKIEINDAELDENLSQFIKIDDTPEEGTPYAEVYAIDPTAINFTEAIVTVTATGTELYKCKEWDFDNQECEGTWELFKTGLIPGEEYTFTLTPDDPGFGEIIATDAVHLDANYTFISNIYDDVKANDDVWSEAIYEGEIVRVTFEQNLTDGRMIDVYVRSNGTIAYFDVYEAGTEHKVGRSGTTENPELQYIEVNNLTKPTDIFDFKVVKVYPNPEDDSTNINPSVKSFLQFDYIHDDFINSSQADGLIGYDELNVAIPRYRLWNESNVYSTELSAQTIGTSGDDITWVVVKANHERDEMIMGTEDKGTDINIQIFNSSYGWSNLLEVSTDVVNLNSRSFDIAIEDVSGENWNSC